ncbi:C-type lectin 9a-like [Cololabis saira]|uniref:C-type lectin 9a-like n=1 Tax=Cololabis saira TaxID=129043 RepID=UPI002AD21276|nr:C-type lectin 9a-like [Cololabis saira]
MATEIQTSPDLRVKFSRGVHKYGRDQDQCEIETLNEENQHSDPDLQQTEKNNQKNLPTVKRNSFRVFKVFLGVFYLLVLVGFIIRYLLVTLEVNQLKTKLNRECSEGWRRFGSSFYRKFTESKTWTESRRECEKRGADLVIISSKEEQDFVGQLDTDENSWIGLKAEWSTSKQIFEWKWVDGSPLKTMFLTAGWSPHQHNQLEYAALCCTYEGKWTYSYHAYKKNWICEK